MLEREETSQHKDVGGNPRDWPFVTSHRADFAPCPCEMGSGRFCGLGVFMFLNNLLPVFH